MSDKRKAVTVTPHLADCWIAAQDHPYPYSPTGGIVYRDAIGRKGNGDTCVWEVWACEDPHCRGEVLVRRLWLVSVVAEELSDGE